MGDRRLKKDRRPKTEDGNKIVCAGSFPLPSASTPGNQIVFAGSFPLPSASADGNESPPVCGTLVPYNKLVGAEAPGGRVVSALPLAEANGNKEVYTGFSSLPSASANGSKEVCVLDLLHLPSASLPSAETNGNKTVFAGSLPFAVSFS